MSYVITLDRTTRLIKVVYCCEEEIKTLSYFPSSSNKPISFTTQEDAIKWVQETVKPEFIDPKCPFTSYLLLRNQYLRSA